jgi:2'-5' RNA ligase
MRVFLAVDLSSEVKERLAGLERELRAALGRARFLRPEGLHLTVRFFGETPAEVVDSLGTRLGEAFEGLPAFALHFCGCGVFPDSRNPRVLWVGVREPPPALFELQSRAESVARTLRFSPDCRRFEPHLTVARFRGRERGIGSALASCREREFGRAEVTEAVLFESRLSPAGASYRRLRSFDLGTPRPV